jgi:hypothetical protein
MFFSFFFISFSLAISSALADDGISEAGTELRSCYDANSILYGGRSCHSPDVIIVAVFGKCIEQENKLYELLKGRDGQKVAEKTIILLRDKLKPQLAAMILDGQVTRNECK